VVVRSIESRASTQRRHHQQLPDDHASKRSRARACASPPPIPAAGDVPRICLSRSETGRSTATSKPVEILRGV